jgi:hypothetical protein
MGSSGHNFGGYTGHSKTSSYIGTTKMILLWSGREAYNILGGSCSYFLFSLLDFFTQSDHARLLNSTREGTSGAEAATPATHIEEEANSTNPAATVSCLEVGLKVVRKLRVCRGFTSTI